MKECWNVGKNILGNRLGDTAAVEHSCATAGETMQVDTGSTLEMEMMRGGEDF